MHLCLNGFPDELLNANNIVIHILFQTEQPQEPDPLLPPNPDRFHPFNPRFEVRPQISKCKATSKYLEFSLQVEHLAS